MVDGSYKKAITKFQGIFKLPETGIISPEMEKMLLAKRCGNPDFGNDPISVRLNIRRSKKAVGLLKRMKRFFIDNPQMKWLKKDLTWK